MQGHGDAALRPPNMLRLLALGLIWAAVDRWTSLCRILVMTLSFVPAAADKLAEVLGEKEAKLMRKKKKQSGGSMRASDQLTADDFITPYIDDEDTDEEE